MLKRSSTRAWNSDTCSSFSPCSGCQVYQLLVSFPDPPVLRAKEGLVYKVGILGCADSAVVGKLHNKTCDTLCTRLDYRTSQQFIDALCRMIFLNQAISLVTRFPNTLTQHNQEFQP